MSKKQKCQCGSATHGHPAGNCDNEATEKDGLCKHCHDRAVKEFYDTDTH
jgi:hypothetical protein